MLNFFPLKFKVVRSLRTDNLLNIIASSSLSIVELSSLNSKEERECKVEMLFKRF